MFVTRQIISISFQRFVYKKEKHVFKLCCLFDIVLSLLTLYVCVYMYVCV